MIRMPRRAISRIAASRCTHCRSSCASSVSGRPLSRSRRVLATAGSVCSAAGVTMRTTGSGLSSSRPRTSAKPECSLNSCRACCGVTSCTAPISGHVARLSANCRAAVAVDVLLQKYGQAVLSVPGTAEAVQVIEQQVQSRWHRQGDPDDGCRHQRCHPVAIQTSQAVQRHLGMALQKGARRQQRRRFSRQ